ncbi:hypothetical protein ACMYSQ_009891 [Aspergillus niger]
MSRWLYAPSTPISGSGWLPIGQTTFTARVAHCLAGDIHSTGIGEWQRPTKQQWSPHDQTVLLYTPDRRHAVCMA